MELESARIKSAMVALFSDKIDQWMLSQQNQTDGFEYELYASDISHFINAIRFGVI